MNRAFSIYLDLVRFGAAVLVYLWHSNNRLLIQDTLPASGYGHSAVVVFFVLSGFVIAYITDTKERTWVSYSASRLSRVYSVALPTLMLTLLLDAIGRQLHPAIYTFPFDHLVVRLVASLLMLNELWFVSITSLSNTPYWSIAFEAWYYILFGVITFVPRRWRLAATLGCALVIGPKILLMLPIWYAGVLLYRWKAVHGLSTGLSACLTVCSLLGIVAVHAGGAYAVIGHAIEALLGLLGFDAAGLLYHLSYAKNFVADYLLATLVFVNFAGMRNIAYRFNPLLLRIERPVRWLASFTFTLYLLHQPLYLFWAAVLRWDPSTPAYWTAVTILTALSIVAVGHVTENRRQRLRHGIAEALQRLSDRRLRVGPVAQAEP